ncbi:MAG: MATE family efflux transporter [Burkholderiales bacterium]|nr:MATE family efflux transporter [Burkholderiales bacterium]
MTLAESARRLAPLAWPVFVGQVSVLAFSTVDTVLVARHGATDLAALAVGAAAYVTVFIGLMGVVLALSPIAGRLFGARDLEGAGRQVHQSLWIVLVLAAAGMLLLVFPHPFLWLAKAGPEVAGKVRGYLFALAFSLPASLLFTIYRGFNTAVSRPKAVMALQIGGLALKVPLSTMLVFGWPALGVPSLGAVGCGIATAIVMWSQVALALAVLRRDPFYAPFRLFGRGLDRPDAAAIRGLLRLGLPMGVTILIEVTGFSFMALFIARAGTTAVAGHQIAANLVSLMFMMPMAMANATGTLVAQSIGARRHHEAVRLGWHGLVLGCALATLLGGAVFVLREGVVRLYSPDAAVVAAALPLVAWVAVFHLMDAVQTICAFVLRAWHIATVPMVIYAVSIWGLGLGGGYVLGFDTLGIAPPSLQGAPGFWIASTVSLVAAAAALTALLAWTSRMQRSEAAQ